MFLEIAWLIPVITEMCAVQLKLPASLPRTVEIRAVSHTQCQIICFNFVQRTLLTVSNFLNVEKPSQPDIKPIISCQHYQKHEKLEICFNWDIDFLAKILKSTSLARFK